MSAQPHPTTPLGTDQPSLACRVLLERDTVRVHPIGSLDSATVPVLEQQLRALREAGFRRLIVDLGGLSFLDSTGLRLAHEWDAAARQDGFEIDFIPGQPAVQRVFELSCSSDQLTSVRTEPDFADWTICHFCKHFKECERWFHHWRCSDCQQ